MKAISRVLVTPFCAAILLAQSDKLAISGDIAAPFTLTSAELAAMPRETVAFDDPESGKIQYEGVPLVEVLKKAGLPYGTNMRGKNLAGYIVASAHDGYQVVFSLGELDPDLGNAKILVVDKRDGKPLFGYQGPLRLVVAGDRKAARSIRMLEKIEVVRLRN